MRFICPLPLLLLTNLLSPKTSQTTFFSNAFDSQRITYQSFADLLLTLYPWLSTAQSTQSYPLAPLSLLLIGQTQPTTLDPTIEPHHILQTPLFSYCTAFKNFCQLLDYQPSAKPIESLTLSLPHTLFTLYQTQLPFIDPWFCPKSNYQYQPTFSHIHFCSYPWLIFYEFFLDNLHIDFIHPSLRSLLDLSTLQQQQAHGKLLQSVFIQPNSQSPYLLPNNLGNCVQWAIDFNHALTFESYPGMQVASFLIPHTPMINLLWFFFDPSLSTQQQTHLYHQYMQTVAEDDILAHKMHQGYGLGHLEKLIKRPLGPREQGIQTLIDWLET